MTNITELKKWTPASNLKKSYTFESIRDEGELSLRVAHDAHTINITFTGIVHGFRRMHTSISNQTVPDWPFYTTKDSNFLSWIIKESLNSCWSESITQFSIFTSSFIIEIVVQDPSKVHFTMYDNKRK